MQIEKKIPEFFPRLFEVDPPSVDARDPLISTGLLLRNFDFHMLAGGPGMTQAHPKGVTLYGAYGGYSVLKRVASAEPRDYFKLLWTPSVEFPIWIGSCGFNDPLDDLLKAYSGTRLGHARVASDGQEALLGLHDIVGLIREGDLVTKMTPGQVASERISVSPDARLLDAIRTMLSHNVRRLFLEKGGTKFVSDRSLLDFMFGPERLEETRASPAKWIDATVSSLVPREAGACSAESLQHAAAQIGGKSDDCLVTVKGSVVSRWDIVMKPWIGGKLTAAPA